jgi:hypothetical protein
VLGFTPTLGQSRVATRKIEKEKMRGEKKKKSFQIKEPKGYNSREIKYKAFSPPKSFPKKIRLEVPIN